MPKDEFNSVEVHNDSSYTVFEFGSTPKTGIFNQRENKSTVSRDEVNDSATKNHENFSSEEGVDQNNFKQQKDLIDKLNTNEGNTVVDSSSSSSSSTASEAGAASGGASAAAGGAGSAAAGTAAGVATVVVTAIAATVGITTISNNNAYCKFQGLEVGITEVTYYLELFDTEETPFRLIIENQSYSGYRDLYEGMNEGTFEQLSGGQTYRIYVQEQSDSKKIIYDSSFTTMKDNQVPNQFNGINFLDASFANNTFTVQLDYTENEEGYFHDFMLVLILDNNEIPFRTSFNLEATTEPQTMSALNTDGSTKVDLRNSSYTYELYYGEGQESRSYTDGSTVEFNDPSGVVVDFGMPTISSEANFITYEFTVTLDYQDDLDEIHDIELELRDFYQDYPAVTIPLEKTLEPQVVNYSEYNTTNPEILRTLTFKPLFNYYEGNRSRALEIGTVKFTDNSGTVPTVNAPTISETANFVDYTFTIKLNYIDELNQITNFYLDCTEPVATTVDTGAAGGNERTVRVPLTISKEVQTVDLTRYSEVPIDIRHKEITFTVVYVYDSGTEASAAPVTRRFTDSSSGVSQVNGVTVSNEISFETYEMSVTLDYRDDYNYYSNFKLVMTDNWNNTTYNVPLTKTTSAQTVSLANYIDDLELVRKRDFKIGLSWTDSEQGSQSISEVYPEFSFSDSSGLYDQTEITGMTFSMDANYATGEFTVTLSYYDPLNLITNISLYMSGDGTRTYQLEKTTEPQTLSNSTDGEGTLFFEAGDVYSYQLSYYKDGDLDQSISGQQTFTDNYSPTYITGCVVDEKTNFGEPTHDVSIDLTVDDYYQTITSASITFTDPNAPATPTGDEHYSQTVSISPTSGSQYIQLDELDLTTNIEWNYAVSYTVNGTTYNGPTGTVTFIDSQPSSVNGYQSDWCLYQLDENFDDLTLALYIDMENPREDISDMSIILGQHEYTIMPMSGWQFIPVGTDFGAMDSSQEVAFQLNGTQYNYLTKQAESVNYFSEIVTLTKGTTSKVLGADVSPYVSGGSIDLSTAIVELDPNQGSFTNFELVFTGTDGEESVDFEPIYNNSTEMTNIDMSGNANYEAIVALLSNGPVSVSIRYYSNLTNQTETVLIKSNLVFDIQV